MFKSNQNGMNTFELNSFSRHWIRTTRFSSKNRSFQSIQIISIWENVFHFGFWCKGSCLSQLFSLTCETCRKIVQFSLNMNRKKKKRKYSTTCLSMCKMLLDFARSQTNCMQHKYEQVASTLKLANYSLQVNRAEFGNVSISFMSLQVIARCLLPITNHLRTLKKTT